MWYKKICLAVLILLLPCLAMAQDTRSWLYKGAISNLPVTMFIKELPNECGGDDSFIGMYRYDKSSEWILLFIEEDKNINWCLTETNFTGVLLLKRGNTDMDGIWIAPDQKKQLKVSMKIQYPERETRKELEEKLDVLMSSENDC